MLKKVMLYLMMLETAIKFLALTFLFSTDFERLPVAVYVSAGVTVAVGIILICKNIIKSVTKKELAVYYGTILCSIIFNLIYMKVFSRAEVSMLELAVIGTVMDILVAAVLVILTIRESKYVRVHVNSEHS